MICTKRKILYIHVPKCAGKSIERHLFNAPGLPRSEHKGVREYDEQTLQDHFTFSFVRNPWDRYVSGIAGIGRIWEPKRPGYYSLDNFKKHLLAETGVNTGHPGAKNPGLWSYEEFFLDENGDMRIDFIGRFENFAEDWDTVRGMMLHAGHLDIDIGPLPVVNAAPKKRPHYSTYYDDESIEIVREVWKWDIETFGYEFEDLRDK